MDDSTNTSLEELRRRETCEDTQTREDERMNGSTNTSLPGNEEDEKTYTLSGLLGILISFYQVKSLLTVRGFGQEKPSFHETISKVFNMDVIFNIGSTLCPSSNVDAVTKRFIKDFLFSILMLALILLTIIVRIIIEQLKPHGKTIRSGLKNHLHVRKDIQRSNYRFIHRLYVSYIRILLLVHKNLAFFSLIMLNCVSTKDKKIMFIQGTRQCYQNWQYGVMVFLAFWIIPFPIALWQAYILLSRKRISHREMLLCLTIPVTTIWYFVTRRHHHGKDSKNIQNNILYQRVQEIVAEPYRLKENSPNEFIFWEHWRLIQRLILAAVATFFINPLERICYVTLCILTYIIVYFKVRPFKTNLKVLHWCEVASLTSFCYLIAVNMFNSFLFSYVISPEEPIPSLKSFFIWMDMICTPITVIVTYFVLLPLWGKLQEKLFCCK